MKSIGDWIYVIFIIIFAVSGMFGSKGKKKRPTVVLGGPEYEPDRTEHTFWEMPEDSDASRGKKAKMPEPVPIPAEPSVGPLNPRTSAASVNATGGEHSILEAIDFEDAEELRKAVIYSEILNRKYY